MSKKFLSPIKLAQGATNPTTGSSGELFFNTVDLKVYAHNGTTWLPSGGGVTVSATAPSSPVAGDCWYDSVDGTLYVYYNDGDSSQWVEVAANSGISVALSGRLGVVETYVTTLQSEMDAVESRALSLETRATALELADSTTNKAGLIPIIPSSVSVTSGTASVASDGTITFSGASGIAIDGIFSSTFRNYRAMTDVTSVNNAICLWQGRVGGVTTTSANYYYNELYASSTSVGASGSGPSGGTTNGRAAYMEAGTFTSVSMDIYSPQIASHTQTFSAHGRLSSGGTPVLVTNTGGCQLTTQFTGINFSASAGTFGGTIKFYGYR